MAILQDEVVGESARALWADAQTMLKQIIDENWLQASAVIGLFPPTASTTTTSKSATPDTGAARMTWVGLRQQLVKTDKDGNANPTGRWPTLSPQRQNAQDYIGAFAVTAGLGIDPHVARFEAANDDYSAILLKALADRLAEAFAELMHHRVRTKILGLRPKRNPG